MQIYLVQRPSFLTGFSNGKVVVSNCEYIRLNLSVYKLIIKITMKKTISSLLLVVFVAAGLFTALSAEAAVRIKGYYKPSTGTYVNPSYRSSPNSSRYDNYSTKGNYNPYSGKKGTKSYYGW